MQAGDKARRRSSVFVIKLGGSIITRKDEAFTPSLDTMNKVAKELAEVYADAKLAIVLGGGSYGHYAAAQQREHDSVAAHALYAVAAAMNELALLVADVLALNGVPSLIYPPHAMCSPRGLQPNCSWQQALKALSKGVVPLTYGDIYPCGSREGWCIVSGDELAMEIGCHIGATKVIYVSDVDGILTNSGEPIPELRLHELELATKHAGGSSHVDVTGGIKRKLDAIRENWCSSIREVWIVNGLKEGRIIGAIKGVGPGTVIRP